MAQTAGILPCELGDGLVMRRARPADADALLHLHTSIFTQDGTGLLDPGVKDWSADFMSGSDPACGIIDFLVVEDSQSGCLVSSLNVISQRWSYGGVEFGVGRPEMVCTRPDYRRRGLVRAQFEAMHNLCRERGQLVCAVSGIAYFYRRFGYEPALSLYGSRSGPRSNVPRLPEGQPEPYVIRPAQLDDAALIAELYEQWCRRSRVACLRDATQWRYDLAGRREQSIARRAFAMLETHAGEVFGLLVHDRRVWHASMGAYVLELAAGHSYVAVAPTVLRYLDAYGGCCAEAQGESFASLWFLLGACSPLDSYFDGPLARYNAPIAWYLHVPDLRAFLRCIAPVLEARLAASPVARHTGELKISFYRSGLHMVFDRGRMVAVEDWLPDDADGGEAAFPDLTFLQLLFGYRELAELRHAFVDCTVESAAARVLLETLFPKQPSNVWPIS